MCKKQEFSIYVTWRSDSQTWLVSVEHNTDMLDSELLSEEESSWLSVALGMAGSVIKSSVQTTVASSS